MDLFLKKPEEVVQLLCERLRTERLAQQMTQAEVAARAGVAPNTVSNLEAGRSVTLENLIRIAMVLGRIKELEGLFLPKVSTIDDITRYENSSQRQRIRRKAND